MIKKYYEYLLALLLSVVLSLLLFVYLGRNSLPVTAKTDVQIAFENASHRFNDLLYRSHNNTPPNPDVLLLTVDEASIIEVGRWPWSRAAVNKITGQLLQYGAKSISYDIIFSEKENSPDGDAQFAKTIESEPDRIILGTFSESIMPSRPYQDFCLTQAFLYTGGGNLAKINPFLSVEDEANTFETVKFDQLFLPLFDKVSVNTEREFLKESSVRDVKELNTFQLNTLKYAREKAIYGYCGIWLTPEDSFSLADNPGLRKHYAGIFGLKSEAELDTTLAELKKTTRANPISQYVMWKQNIDELQSVSRYTASFVADPDPDGVVRSYPLVMRTGNQLGTSYVPSLALQAYLAATGYQSLFKITSGKNEKKLEQAEIRDVSGEKEITVSELPVDHEGKLLVNYYGKQNTVHYASAKDLLNDSDYMQFYTRVPARDYATYTVKVEKVRKDEFLKNKNVIFGVTAVGSYDIRATPTDIKYPGPEIHATVLSNLLNHEYLSYARHEFPYSPALFFVFIFLTLVIYLKTGLRNASILFVLQAAMLVYLMGFFYGRGVLFQSSFMYLVLLAAAFLFAFTYKYFFQSRKSKEMKLAFSKYVSKDLVEEILRNESAIELRGQKLHMSVYFSDIRGFTEFSEKMDPVELSELLNRYFTPMSEIITRHRGTIDKYIGDAVMAMFGAPVNYKDHAYNACVAALECVAALGQLNQEFSQRGWPAINIGIGINTGFMNAGNIGSATIQNYTVIGDSVNLASRLESLNKEYGTQIIISEYTYEIVKDRCSVRELAKVNVKGKKEPVVIYELLGLKENT